MRAREQQEVASFAGRQSAGHVVAWLYAVVCNLSKGRVKAALFCRSGAHASAGNIAAIHGNNAQTRE